MTADALLLDVVDRWVTGWSAVRRLDPPTRRPDGLVEVEVGGRGRRQEWFLTEPSERTLDRVCADLAATDDVWLTVFGPEPARARPGTGVLAADEVLMARELTVRTTEGRAVVVADGDRASATVWADGVAASRGWVGLVGAVAVFDRIETDEAHRRRGLGGEVMGSLESWAVDSGVTDGLLAATVAGQALYARLGWSVLARMTTLSASGPSSASS